MVAAAPVPSSRRHHHPNHHHLASHFHLPHFHPNLFKPHIHHAHHTPLGTPTTQTHSHRTDMTHSHRTVDHEGGREGGGTGAGAGGAQPETAASSGAAPARPAPCCPAKMIIFTVNLLLGLLLSQLLPSWLDASGLSTWKATVKVCTMFCLSYIMIHVGYEFDIDKSRVRSYGKDYLVGMSAAGLPWIGVALWFSLALPRPLGWKQSLVAARFAAPTSAGILFAMLEAAGLKSTWLFQKARILAIFDDLDTILLMVPLKVLVVGMRWELSIDLGLVVVCFVLIWTLLHTRRWPASWRATLGYAGVVW